ncbi:MAG TPA: tetratricopeptide repeat protein [Vicinamibacterales bacterium]|nr:tetratricopeptide repeat protein [Vicinamibacterales bacterium]
MAAVVEQRLRRSAVVLCCCLSGLVVSANCAPKAPPTIGVAPKHPDFVFPATPEGTAPTQSVRIDRGWQWLQLDDFRSAEREFSAALKQQPSFHPAETGLAYLAMARDNEKDAVARFERALQVDAGYVPALIGRGLALLELERHADALTSFEAALAKDPSLVELRGRIDVLRFRATQEMLGRAKTAAEARRWDEAAAIYRQAIAASPDSSFLYRDLAAVEQKAGQTASALEHYRRAVELDPGDAKSLAGIGAILDEQGDVLGASAAYERAHAIDAAEVPESVMTRLRAAAALAKLPAEYRAIPERAQVTRADIAALIGVRLDALLGRAKPRQVIITDIRGHWAQTWINPVVRSGVMDTLPNYEFEPSRRVRRNELATTVSRLLSLIAAARPELARKWQGMRVPINDVASTHLSYPAVSAAVASGVMPLAGGNFELLRGVSGTEAMEIVGRLEALARP